MAGGSETRHSGRGSASSRRPASGSSSPGGPPSSSRRAAIAAGAGSDIVTVAALPQDSIVVGRVGGSWGVRGALRIEPFNEPEDSVLLTARRWYLSAPSADVGVRAPGRVERPFPLPAMVSVTRCRAHGGSLVATVTGIEVKEVADALRGCQVAVSRADFPEPAQGEYYWVDLIGCEVVTPSGVGLGSVEAVDDHGAHPLLRLRDREGRERLIPFVEAHVPEVDLVGRRIVADWDPDF